MLLSKLSSVFYGRSETENFTLRASQELMDICMLGLEALEVT